MKRLALVVAVAACGDVSGNSIDAARHIDSPRAIEGAIDGHPLDRCDPNKPFGAPVALDEINTVGYEIWPSLTADELTVYFQSNRGGSGSVGGQDIYVATR